MKTRSAALIALLSFAALLAQFAVTHGLPQFANTPAVLWAMAGYFTVLTNLGVLIFFASVAAGKPASVTAAGAITLAIAAVGILYHVLLAQLYAHQELAWWADHGLHTATPLAVTAWWLAFVRQGSLVMLPVWLIWPALYTVYALARGALTGFWPYPFLDVDRLGWSAVLLGLPGLFAAFAALGLAMIGLARLTR